MVELINTNIKLAFLFILSFNIVFLANALVPHGCGPLKAPEVPPLSVTNATDYELKQVSLVFRHGDRLMYQDQRCWPNDLAVWNCSVRYLSHPNSFDSNTDTSPEFLFRKTYLNDRNYYRGNCETGQLTDRGFYQEVAAGEMYRKVYVDSGFLPKTYDPSITYLRSDESDRCVQSLQAIFMGLYPRPTFDNGESLPLFNINTMDSFYDNIVPNGNVCPLWSEYVTNSTHDQNTINHWKSITAPLLQKLSVALNFSATTWGDFQQIHDCLVVHSCHDQPIPSGVTQQLYDLTMEEYSYYYHLSYSYPNYLSNAQAGIGYFLYELVNDFMYPVVNRETSAYKLLFFSGHDTTLLPILTALQAWDGVIWAHYASQMQFEIYENKLNSQFYVRIVYNGNEILVPGCSSTLCDWNDFHQYIATLFPVPDQCSPSYYSHYY